MNILFITIENHTNFSTRSIYMDLVNEFRDKGNHVTVLSACETRDRKKEYMGEPCFEETGEIQKVFIPNITKMSNYILKGINLILSIYAFDKAVKKILKNRQYDLVVYGSPPISIYKAVQRVKKKCNAKTYLLLKDIWPYDCLFGDALSKSGWKRIPFEFLAYLARQLYEVSDTIGCMSPANIQFLMEHEPSIPRNKIEECPNSVKPFNVKLSNVEKSEIRKKYNIPTDKVVFLYGGNLGIAQGIDFAIKSIKASNRIDDAVFVFIGDGTERKKLEELYSDKNVRNFILLNSMPKDEFETLVFACDVGLIYLNNECLAPNYPSRLLSYMQASLPVLCATDTCTDIGYIAEKNGYGLACESSDITSFTDNVRILCNDTERAKMGKKSYEYFTNNYTVSHTYCKIMKNGEK